MSTNPRMLFFIVKKKTRKLSEKEKIDIYNDRYKIFYDYFKHHGHDGFLSEKTYLQDIIFKTKQSTDEAIFDIENIEKSIENVVVTDQTSKNIIEMVENRQDFIKWIG